MDFGFHSTLRRAVLTQVSADNNVLQSRQACLDAVNHQLRELDQRSDKQSFLEASSQLFSQPQLFEFQPHRGDDVSYTAFTFGAVDLCLDLIYPTDRQINTQTDRTKNITSLPSAEE